jgi:hypothetical protein
MVRSFANASALSRRTEPKRINALKIFADFITASPIISTSAELSITVENHAIVTELSRIDHGGPRPEPKTAGNDICWNLWLTSC